MVKMKGSILALLLVLALSLSGCTRGSTGIVVSGSTTVEPIAEVAGEDYHKAHPEVSVLVSGLGSSAGIEAVGITKTADIGTSSRSLKDEEKKLGLTVIPIALVSLNGVGLSSSSPWVSA